MQSFLAKALVPFYPSAGRLVKGADDRLKIDCNAAGALFLVAKSELTLDGFTESELSPEVRDMLICSIKHGWISSSVPFCAVHATGLINFSSIWGILGYKLTLIYDIYIYLICRKILGKFYNEILNLFFIISISCE